MRTSWNYKESCTPFVFSLVSRKRPRKDLQQTASEYHVCGQAHSNEVTRELPNHVTSAFDDQPLGTFTWMSTNAAGLTSSLHVNDTNSIFNLDRLSISNSADTHGLASLSRPSRWVTWRKYASVATSSDSARDHGGSRYGNGSDRRS